MRGGDYGNNANL